MKITKMLPILITLFTINLIAQEADTTLKIISFDTSLHCADCKTKITDSFQEVKGITSIDVKIEEKVVTIVFDPNVIKMESLVEKLNELGYSAYILDYKDFKIENGENKSKKI